jgi:putative NADPH-quinone reductase
MLKDRTLQLVLTTGGPESVYRVGGYNLSGQGIAAAARVTAHLRNDAGRSRSFSTACRTFQGSSCRAIRRRRSPRFAGRYRGLLAV